MTDTPTPDATPCDLCNQPHELEALTAIDLPHHVSGAVRLCGPCVQAVAGIGHRAETQRRLAEGKQRAKEEGRWHSGTPPFGYTVGRDGRLEAVAAELRVVEWMVEQRRRGFSWSAITTGLNESGVPAPRGGRWTVGSVRRIVERDLAAYADRASS